MGEDATPRVGLYARVSLDRRDGRSPEEQLDDGEQDAEQRGWSIVARYVDKVSASRFATRAREDWPKVLADITAGRLDIVLLWESSRGDRDPETWLGFLRLCRDRRVLIHVHTHDRTYDMTNARDWKTLAEEGVANAYSSEETSLRVRRTKMKTLKKGRPDSRVAYGYRSVYHPETGKLIGREADPERAPVVRRVYELVEQGVPLSEAARRLAAVGAPTATEGKPWTRTMVRRIALNPVYVSKRIFQGQEYPGDWPPLVDEATWLAVQRLLSDPKRKTTRPGRARHLLSYVMVCDVCGLQVMVRTIRHSKRKKGRKDWVGYCCPNSHAAVRQDAADEYVTEAALAYAASDEIYRPPAGRDADVLAARREVQELRARLDEFVDQAATGGLSAAALARVEARLLPQIAEAERRERATGIPPQLRRLLDAGADVRAQWAAMPVAARKDALRALVRVRLRPATEGRSVSLLPTRIRLDWLSEAQAEQGRQVKSE